jgi:sulfur relay (sulfurtransferase) complex TusBCD TusD component (DsrE family)
MQTVRTRGRRMRARTSRFPDARGRSVGMADCGSLASTASPMAKEAGMKVAYVFSTGGRNASYKLGTMILPQLEDAAHGAEVVGMFFFDDNNYVLRSGDPIGERLSRIARDTGMLLMMCDRCAIERGLASGEPGAAVVGDVVDGVQVGCFPDLYAALAGDPPDQVITL